MASEFDPLFIKGLRLLHSKSKDSTDQLKQLLDEMILQSKQSNSKDRIYTTVKLEGENKLHIKKAPRDVTETTFSKYSSDDNRDRKPDKRQLEKNKQENVEIEAKIPKLEPPQVYSYYPSSPDLPKLDQYVTKKEEESDSSDDNADADDFAMEMGLACVICNQIEVTQGNQLIECQECHSLYHQECHRPPATNYDYNDPRRVWYCAKCVKNMKKMATKTQKNAKSGAAAPPKEPVSQAKSTKAENSPPALILPFKRSELKTPISQANSQTTANKPIGLAGLAANFGGRTTTSSSTAATAPAARSMKISSSASNLKTLTPFSSSATSKTSTSSTASTMPKTASSSAFQSLSLTTTSNQSSSATSSSSQKLMTTSTTATKGLGLLSAAVASASSRSAASAAAGNGGGNSHKVVSCSPLMSADKRLQIMKKKASKQQERRRLSTK